MTSIHQHLQDCLADLTDALTILHRLLPRATTLRRLEDKGDKGCQSCSRVMDHKGRPLFSDTRSAKGVLCRNCEGWKREKGVLPPLGVLEMWRDGIRLTTPRVAEAERAEKDRTKRKRKKAS